MNSPNLTPVLISGVSCYEQDGTAYLKLEDVARGLGFTQTQNKNGTEYISIRWETINRYLEEIGFPNKLGKDSYIPENIFYRLAMKAKNETAEKFQALVADEIIPSIRKTGSYTMPKLSKEMQALFLLDDRTQKQEQRITALENTMTVDYSQQQALKKAVGRVVVEALGGKAAPAYNDPHVRGKLFSECNRDVQDWFRVNSVCNVPRKDFTQAVEYIQRWKPSTNSVMLIQQTNAQTCLFDPAGWLLN
ncbi:ORF6C domain-containing protein [bacterium]|nr:ORF6C domain-containing protein [bacterium]